MYRYHLILRKVSRPKCKYNDSGSLRLKNMKKKQSNCLLWTVNIHGININLSTVNEERNIVHVTTLCLKKTPTFFHMTVVSTNVDRIL